MIEVTRVGAGRGGGKACQASLLSFFTRGGGEC